MSQITNIKASGGGTGVVETLTANSGVATAVANNINVLGDGTSITTTASGSTLTIDFIGSSSGITTLDGNTGSATGSTVTIETINTNIPFVGSGSTLSIDFSGVALGTNNTLIGQNPATSGGFNTVSLGNNALSNWVSGNENTAIGISALQQTINSSFNTCVGASAGGNIVTDNSNSNTLIGASAGNTLGSSGSSAVSNTALGYQAGINWTNSESNNICIGSAGVINQNGTITLGTNGTHTSCFIRGIDSVNVGSVATVVTESGDQLGTAVITAGSGISVTPSANAITIDSLGVTTINGDTGSVTGSTITLEAGVSTQNCGSTVLFSGSGTTMTMEVTDASNNTILGKLGGNSSISGNGGTGFGYAVFQNLSSGIQNTALGYASMNTADGSYNTCVGALTGYNLNSTANQNTLIGYNSGNGLGATAAGGSNNVAVGYDSGLSWLGSESNNICIGNIGTRFQSGVITIGTNGTHTSCFVTGIQGVTVTGTAVLVSAGDQLGVAVSSRKYKENIEDMGDISSDILNLRPVTFNLKDHEDKSLQYGLIAEEVAEIFPGLVVNDKEGNPQTVKYHELPALLLNELQKSIAKIAELEERINSLEAIVNDYN